MSRNKKLIIALIIIGVVFLYNLLFPSKNWKRGSFSDEIKDREIKSIISKKFVDDENHNIPYLVYGGKDSIIIYRDWWDKIAVGDSITKPKDSLELIIKNSHKIERLNYRDKFGLE